MGRSQRHKLNTLGEQSNGLPYISLSADTVANNASPGTVVGALSVVGSPNTWTLSMLSSANNMFALSGSNLVVGATALVAGSKPMVTVNAYDPRARVNIRKTFIIRVT